MSKCSDFQQRAFQKILRPKLSQRNDTHAGTRHFSLCTQDNTRRNATFQTADHFGPMTLKSPQVCLMPLKISEVDWDISINNLYQNDFFEKRRYKYYTRTIHPSVELSRKGHWREVGCDLMDDNLENMHFKKKEYFHTYIGLSLRQNPWKWGDKSIALGKASWKISYAPMKNNFLMKKRIVPLFRQHRFTFLEPLGKHYAVKDSCLWVKLSST